MTDSGQGHVGDANLAGGFSGVIGFVEHAVQIRFFSVEFPKIERHLEFVGATAARSVHPPVADVANPVDADRLLLLALWTGKGNDHLVVHKNFNIRGFVFAHNFFVR